jgi:hypothetical protein
MHSLWLRTSDHHWRLCKSMSQSVDIVVMMYQHIGFNIKVLGEKMLESKHEDPNTKTARKRFDNASKNCEPSP